MSTVTGMFPNAITPAFSLERGQQAVPSPVQDSELFKPVSEPEASSATLNRRERNPDERLMGGSPLYAPTKKESPPSRSSEPSPKPLQSEQELRAAKRRGQLNAEQQAKLAEIEQLAQRDREVRRHEQAHQAVGGQYTGAVSYVFTQGPDGRKYAIAGEVSVDMSRLGDPEDTIQKMEQIKRAALAPAEPSSQDRRIAAEAAQIIVDARAEALKIRLEESDESAEKRRGLREDFQFTTEQRRERREAEKAEKEAAQGVDEGADRVNTEILAQLSRTQLAISEMLKNQRIPLSVEQLGKVINAQI